jgi:hypothetical protein
MVSSSERASVNEHPCCAFNFLKNALVRRIAILEPCCALVLNLVRAGTRTNLYCRASAFIGNYVLTMEEGQWEAV